VAGGHRPIADTGRTLRWHCLHDDQEVRVPDQRPATGPEATDPEHETPEHGNPDGRNPDGRNPDGRNPDGRNPHNGSPQSGSQEHGSPGDGSPGDGSRATGDGLLAGGIAAVDAIADGFQLRAGQPGLAYGIVAAGSLVHARGLGERRLGGAVPDAGTVFRIASMTKSFTAAAILALRDDGALALDDPAEQYVPELRGLRPATADSPRISIRHLLTMTAGFPTDDPWGDRQQGLPPGEFAEFLRGGVSFAWAPGTRFEYANLGYAILGRVVAAAAGTGYLDFVRERLLGPLGMFQTGFEAAEFHQAQLAAGYRRDGGGWAELVPDPSGAFAPMGGIFSTVGDLARWVSGFTAAFPPGDEAAGGPHPLRRATRREMQLAQVAQPRRGPSRLVGDAGQASYGFGLFVEEDPVGGLIIQHSGGYPGFGSHMRWHPETGIGVIVLANSTYAGAHPLGTKMMDALLAQRPPAAGSHRPVRGPAPDPAGPWPETLRAQQAVSQILQSWDDAAAGRLFSENVAQDEPFAERRATIELVRQRIGAFHDDPARAAEFDSPGHCRWWLRGEHGAVQAEIRLTPERRPRVQSLTLAVPPAPDSPLGHVIEALLTFLNDNPRDLPLTLPVSGSVDSGLLTRQLRAAAAWAGRCQPSALRGGDGETRSTVELAGETARLILSVVVDPAEHLLQEADIQIAT
jgi:CubicO group peptidase (beta-lactamase class C family)